MRPKADLVTWFHRAGAVLLLLCMVMGIFMPALKPNTDAPLILRLHVWGGLCTLTVFLARIVWFRGLSRASTGPLERPRIAGQMAQLAKRYVQILTLLSSATGALLLLEGHAVWLAYPWSGRGTISWSQDQMPVLYLLHRVHACLFYGIGVLVLLHIGIVCRSWRKGRHPVVNECSLGPNVALRPGRVEEQGPDDRVIPRFNALR